MSIVVPFCEKLAKTFLMSSVLPRKIILNHGELAASVMVMESDVVVPGAVIVGVVVVVVSGVVPGVVVITGSVPVGVVVVVVVVGRVVPMPAVCNLCRMYSAI